MTRKHKAGTWEGHPSYRWTKMVKGVRYRLLCRSKRAGEEEKENTAYLNLPETDWTKARSLDAANEWWGKWSSLSPQVVGEMNTIADNIAKFDRALTRLGVQKIPENNELAKSIFENLDSIEETTPSGQSLQYWIEQRLTLKESEKCSPGRYDNFQRSLRRFRDTLPKNSLVTAIDWQAWDKYVIKIKSANYASRTERDYIGDAKKFVEWLQRRSLIAEVKNLSEAKTKIFTAKIEHFSKDELRKMLKDSKGMLRCFLLFFCNCGFRQSDVATLTPDMFDGKYITRKRKKSEKTNAPEVSWILWQETIDAINEFKSESGQLLFCLPDGRTWVKEELKEKLDKTKRRSRDDIFYRELWESFAEKNKLRLSCGDIRGSCANLLKSDSGRTNQLSVQIKYLGQSPAGVVFKHYIDPPQIELDSAIMRLRGTLLE